MSNVLFKRVHTAGRGTSTYRAAGYPGVLLLAKPAFNGEHPESITVGDVPDAIAGAKASRAKMSPEEKTAAKATEKARLKAMTPAQRAQEKLDRAKKNFEAAEKRAAKLAGA